MRLIKRSLIFVTLTVISVSGYIIASGKVKPLLAPLLDQAEIELVSVGLRCQQGRHCLLNTVSSSNGAIWAVGYDGQHTGRIYYSKDGGSNWAIKVVPTKGFNLSAITFADAYHGWAIGGDGTILRTADRGGRWNLVPRPTHADLNAIHFFNKELGYIAGRTGYYDRAVGTHILGIQILRTRNGGDSWQICYEDRKSGGIFQIVALSPQIAIAVVDGRYLLRTDDGGASWQPIKLPQNSVFNVAFTSDGTGWAVGQQGGFYKSTDKAKTWHSPRGLPESLAKHDWYSIGFIDANMGMAVGNNGVVAITYDRGNTWLERQANVKEDLRQIVVQNPTGLIVGSDRIYSINFSNLH